MKKTIIIGVLLLIVIPLIIWTKLELKLEVEEGNGLKKDIIKEEKFDPNKLRSDRENALEFSLTEDPETNTIIYSIKNVGNVNETLAFTTSQRYDYVLSSEEHGLIERYSDGKNFLQVLSEITIKPGEEVKYSITLPELKAGTYKITVNSAATGVNSATKTLLFTKKQ